MDNQIYNNISNSNISRNVNIKSNYSQTNTQLLGLGANLMPTERQTKIGVFNPSAVSKANLDMQRYTTKRLFSPNNAPSTITSETFLMFTCNNTLKISLKYQVKLAKTKALFHIYKQFCDVLPRT